MTNLKFNPKTARTAVRPLPLLSTLSLTAAFAFGVPQIASAQTGSAPPAVTVNHHAVDFAGQPPIEQNGHLLVPLRGVLEQLGAYVEFDEATQTVTARRGDTQITLPIGQQTATVNGTPVSLDIPAQLVNGSTMVPLRFLAESLGANVSFDVSSDTVSIDAEPGVGSPHWVGGLARHHDMAWRDRHFGTSASGEATVRGNVVALFGDSTPMRVVIKVASDGGTADIAPGSDITIPLRSSAAITREHNGGTEESISLDGVSVGDRVAILRSPDGAGEAVDVLEPNESMPFVPRAERDFIRFKGEFARSEPIGGHVLRVWTADGHSIEMSDDVPVHLGNSILTLEDLRPGDILSVALDPTTHHATSVAVVRGG